MNLQENPHAVWNYQNNTPLANYPFLMYFASTWTPVWTLFRSTFHLKRYPKFIHESMSISCPKTMPKCSQTDAKMTGRTIQNPFKVLYQKRNTHYRKTQCCYLKSEKYKYPVKFWPKGTTCWTNLALKSVSNLINISIRSSSGPRVAKTLILHYFGDGFWDQLCSKIAKQVHQKHIKNQCKPDIAFVCQNATWT